jgi:hypothetical protein
MKRKKVAVASKIHKDELLGKYIEYMDSQGKVRTNKVVKVSGRSVTVVDALKKRRKIKAEKIFCQVHHGHCKVEIDWSIRRKKKTEVENER